MDATKHPGLFPREPGACYNYLMREARDKLESKLEDKREKRPSAYLIKLNKLADEPRKKAEERVENPRYYSKPKPTTRKSSLEFWAKHH